MKETDFIHQPPRYTADQAAPGANHVGQRGRRDTPDQHPLAAPDGARENVSAAHICAQKEIGRRGTRSQATSRVRVGCSDRVAADMAPHRH